MKWKPMLRLMLGLLILATTFALAASPGKTWPQFNLQDSAKCNR